MLNIFKGLFQLPSRRSCEGLLEGQREGATAPIPSELFTLHGGICDQTAANRILCEYNGIRSLILK